MKQLTVPPNSSHSFDNIQISANTAGDDSLTARVVFYSGSTSDTVYVKGIAQGCCEAVKYPTRALHPFPLNTAIPRDANGRAVTYPHSTTILKATKSAMNFQSP